MTTRANVTFRLGLVLAGLCLLVGPIATAQAQPLRADCPGALRADLGTVQPGGLSCAGQRPCSTAAQVPAPLTHAWIDAGTGAMSTEEASETPQAIMSHAWIDAGTGTLSQDRAGDATAGAGAAATVWMDAGAGAPSLAAAAQAERTATAATACTTPDLGLAIP